jgi:diguanylate cyclase (GGDEF)-like protein
MPPSKTAQVSGIHAGNGTTIEEICSMLRRAGVPNKVHWQSLILYLRTLSEYHFLSEQQKVEIQAMITELLARKAFSDEDYREIITRTGNILFAPYRDKLRQSFEETVALLTKFQELHLSRKNDIQDLEHKTIQLFEQDQDIDTIISTMRTTFQSVISRMEQDARTIFESIQIDSLTKVHTRKAFDDHIHLCVAQAQKDQTPLCMAMLDIDDFKAFNDTHGHRIGDQALSTVGKIVKNVLDEHQHSTGSRFFAARYGGEEFAILFPECGLQEGLSLTETICEQVFAYSFVIRNAKGRILKKDIRLSVSCGVAQVDHDMRGDLAALLVEMADRAMYEAKAKGKNQVCILEPDSRRQRADVRPGH